jgi:glycerophosphoryl diester phosphodiesterase
VKRRWLWAALLMFAAALYIANASWAWGEPGQVTIFAHRGLAQDYSRAGLTNETCTAAQMLPPTHGYLENTLPSIGKALAYGADVVEVDVHPTVDGEFAVFHDWRIDCRTEGRGVTREQSMAYLKTLDVGYGYTADGGRTFPFRGRYVGAMPTLAEVVQAFPNARLFVNVKSNDPREGDLLVDYLRRRSIDRAGIMFYGGERPLARIRARLPSVRTLSKESLKACASGYMLLGWTGQVPKPCRNAVIYVPLNLRGLVWGWPNLFVERMRSVNTEVVLIGPVGRDLGRSGSTGVDDPAQVSGFIRGYAGGLSTDRIDVMGPAMRAARD